MSDVWSEKSKFLNYIHISVQYMCITKQGAFLINLEFINKMPSKKIVNKSSAMFIYFDLNG